ncbi:hypothetical protein ACVXHB_26190 [Escherichia coli]
MKLCEPKKPIEPVYANRFFEVLSESIARARLIVSSSISGGQAGANSRAAKFNASAN